MKTKTMAEILGDFSTDQTDKKNSLKHGAPVTIWIPAEAKEKYDRLQKISERRFSKKAREALLELIAVAEALAPT